MVNCISDFEIQKLIKKADDVRKNAHAPYSNFRVGCSILCEDGTIFTGCNVENASYGLTICAERTAILKAVSEGNKSFRAIAVCCDIKNASIGPCGACRQCISEFTMDIQIFITSPGSKKYNKHEFKDLLPMPFTPDALKLKK